MFSYFGAKTKIINLYPLPEFDHILEPFCGSARYACRYGLQHKSGRCRQVWINDLYEPIYRIWKWIQQATRKDVENLPELNPGDNLDDIKWLSDDERLLMGYMVNIGVTHTRKTYTRFAARDQAVSSIKRKLLTVVGRINHWKITNLDFRRITVPTPATYFVDPPYQTCKYQYGSKHKHIENFYQQVRFYSKNKRGQVIVCEGNGADWWNFEKLCESYGQRGKQIELVKILHNP